MAKVIYEAKYNNVNVSLEFLNHWFEDNRSFSVFGYTVGDTGGLLSGEDLLTVITALETGDFTVLSEANEHKIAFVNDLVRYGIIDKNTYLEIYPNGESVYDAVISE